MCNDSLAIVQFRRKLPWGGWLKDLVYVFLAQNGAQQLPCKCRGRDAQAGQGCLGRVHYAPRRDHNQQESVACLQHVLHEHPTVVASQLLGVHLVLRSVDGSGGMRASGWGLSEGTGRGWRGKSG